MAEQLTARPLAALKDTCACGWKHFADDPADLEAARTTHDPGDSCCGCGGWQCLACASGEPHLACKADCPECCLRGDGGLTLMDRQRQAARRHARRDSASVLSFMDALIGAYGKLARRDR